MTEQSKAEMTQRALFFGQLVDRFGSEVLDVVSRHTSEQTKARLENATWSVAI